MLQNHNFVSQKIFPLLSQLAGVGYLGDMAVRSVSWRWFTNSFAFVYLSIVFPWKMGVHSVPMGKEDDGQVYRI